MKCGVSFFHADFSTVIIIVRLVDLKCVFCKILSGEFSPSRCLSSLAQFFVMLMQSNTILKIVTMLLTQKLVMVYKKNVHKIDRY
jgi:hypothetical protein